MKRNRQTTSDLQLTHTLCKRESEDLAVKACEIAVALVAAGQILPEDLSAALKAYQEKRLEMADASARVLHSLSRATW